jgi:hypothetical protein
VLEHTVSEHTRELRRRHRHRFCECGHAGHLLFLLSSRFGCPNVHD